MADLDKIRATVKRWAPTLAAGTMGAVIGVSLGVGAVAAIGVSRGNLIMLIAISLAVVMANVAFWWLWGGYKAESVRIAREQRQYWIGQHGEQERRAELLAVENARLAAQVELLTHGEVVSLLHQRMGDAP